MAFLVKRNEQAENKTKQNLTNTRAVLFHQKPAPTFGILSEGVLKLVFWIVIVFCDLNIAFMI